MILYFIGCAIFLGVVALDQISKILVVKFDANAVIIPELLKFHLTYNKGASFSFLSDKSWAQGFFITLTFIVIACVLGWVIYSFIKKKTPTKWIMVSISLVMGGAVGNLIDRLLFRKVRDFIYVFYNTDIFPAIFNVADIALVVGVIMICVYLLFLDKDAVFKKSNKNKTEENCDNEEENSNKVEENSIIEESEKQG